MKITADYLHNKWKEINYFDGGYMQIALEMPLEWYAGYKGIDQKTLMLISEFEPEPLASSKSIVVSKGKRPDNRWTLSLTLMRQEQESVFEMLCADVMDYSYAANGREALSRCIKRYKQWDRLLEHQRKSLMDESNRKGLFGELLFVSQLIKDGKDSLATLQGWVGPDGGDQDFVFLDGWREIKTLGQSADAVSISSLEQLDCTDPGEIVIMRVDKCAPEHIQAMSLLDIVHEVTALISESPSAVELLNTKLVEYGFMELPEYGEQKYFFSGKQRYRVDTEFPKLTADNTASAITAAHYSISIAGIENWKVEE